VHVAVSHSTAWPPQPLETAGFVSRTVAYLVDAILLSFVGGAFPYLVMSNNFGPSSSAGQQVGSSAGGSVVVSLIYFVVFWSAIGGGRTLGMRLLGLKVVREQDMTQLGVVTALVRWVGLWVSFALCFAGVIWVAFDSRHQGWHDKLARTLVVHA
jgi:uncharacterized RDD family membrane protein YckC